MAVLQSCVLIANLPFTGKTQEAAVALDPREVIHGVNTPGGAVQPCRWVACHSFGKEAPVRAPRHKAYTLVVTTCTVGIAAHTLDPCLRVAALYKGFAAHARHQCRAFSKPGQPHSQALQAYPHPM